MATTDGVGAVVVDAYDQLCTAPCEPATRSAAPSWRWVLGITLAALAGSANQPESGDPDFGDNLDKSGRNMGIGVGSIIGGGLVGLISAFAFADKARSETP